MTEREEPFIGGFSLIKKINKFLIDKPIIWFFVLRDQAWSLISYLSSSELANLGHT